MALKYLLLLSLATTCLVAQDYTLICNNTGIDTANSNIVYSLRTGSEYCYRYFDLMQTFNDAVRICEKEAATLLRIDSQEEYDYINSTYSSKAEFWIGLSDIQNEGAFNWVDGEPLTEESFQIWRDGAADVYNTISFDCAKFTPQGWQVHQGFCSNELLSFACRQRACNSTDGITCYIPAVESSSSLSVAVIIVIVIVPLVILIIVGVVLFLIIMWKFQNDIFNKYICCCVYGSSKAQVNSLKQEIQRLQTELSQHKLNSSGRFSQMSSSRKQSQVSLMQPQPSFGRSFSTNKIVPENGIAVAPQTRIGRNSSFGLIKSPLPPVSEQQSPT